MPKLTKRLPAAARGDGERPEPVPAPPARVVPLEKDSGTLGSVVQPDRDKPSWDMDLSVFASGARDEGIQARPGLTADLAPVIRARSRGRNRIWGVQTRTHLKTFWQFLDDLDARGGGKVERVADVGDAFGQFFKTWLLQERGMTAANARSIFGTLRWMLSAGRQRLGLPGWGLVWPTIERERGTRQHKDVDPQILKPFYNVLKSHHARGGAAMREGAELLRRGEDPRRVGSGTDQTAWSEPANIALLTHEFIGRALSGNGAWMGDIAPRLADPGNSGLPVHGPSAFAAPDRNAFGVIRWFVPTFEDAACALFLIMLHLGWNLDTVANIDVTSDEAWSDKRLDIDGSALAGTAAVYGYKGKVGKEQIAFSLVKPHAHPYQVVRAMVERTQPLRDALRNRLAELDALPEADEGERCEAAELRGMIKSPWLYFSRRPSTRRSVSTRVGVIKNSNSAVLDAFRQFARHAHRSVYRARKKGADRELYRPLLTLTPSDLRDGFASFLYENSLYNILLLKRALGHGDSRATRAYIRQRRQIAQRFKEYTELQEILFDEIRAFRRIDPTILFLRCASAR